MSRSITLALWLGMTSAAFGQASVESGLGASRAATSTAPARGLGKSMSGIAGSLDKALKPAQKSVEETPSPVTAAKEPVTSASAAPAPAPKYEDAGGIAAGLTYEELLHRFGPPAMAMSFDGESSLSYQGKAGTYQVTVAAGKVKAIEKPER
jgi:hypothetical protein